jgi:hypothetical protein
MKHEMNAIKNTLALALMISLFLSGCGSAEREGPKPGSATTANNANNSDASAFHPDPAGGGTRERGDTSPAEFEGTTAATEKKRADAQPAVLREVRTGLNTNFDRIVFEFEGKAMPGYRIEYVDKPATCGEGSPVTLAGKARLSITLSPAQAHTEAGEATIKDRERKLSLKVLKELKLTCDFEADVTWVSGLAASKPYRVLELENPSRLVVDVKH